ncbi:MAG TPA: RyR domain-containing protein, partial [Xanthobacteraceae bacterium]|nr:RyR domain-containing protein [Xanthobacteraceae bacterium]
ARRIPDVLALVGLGLVSQEDVAAGNKPSDEQIKRCIEENIELLAEAEHDGWMAQRTKNGWRHGTPRDDARKVHPLMVPYGDLPKEEKDKDRRAVRAYPTQVKAAGFTIVWLPSHAFDKRPRKRKSEKRRGRRKTN